MTKGELQALERLFKASLPVELGGDRYGLVQSKAKVFEKLAEKGLAIRHKVALLGGRLPVVIEGWTITSLGHLTYCAEASED